MLQDLLASEPARITPHWKRLLPRQWQCMSEPRWKSGQSPGLSELWKWPVHLPIRSAKRNLFLSVSFPIPPVRLPFTGYIFSILYSSTMDNAESHIRIFHCFFP